METVEELKEVYNRNFYPSALFNSKLKLFLANSEKPERKPTNHTICLEYQSPLIEHSICDLTRRMSKFVPGFRVNVSYRFIKISKLFTHLAEAQIDTYEKYNVTYCFKCLCDEKNIGQTLRLLKSQADWYIFSEQYLKEKKCGHLFFSFLMLRTFSYIIIKQNLTYKVFS